jgi:hypothetical protein
MCVAGSLPKDVDVVVWNIDGGPIERTLYAVLMPRWTYDLDQKLHSIPYLVTVKLLEWLQFWNRLDTKPSNVKEESCTTLIIFTRPYTLFCCPIIPCHNTILSFWWHLLELRQVKVREWGYMWPPGGLLAGGGGGGNGG